MRWQKQLVAIALAGVASRVVAAEPRALDLKPGKVVKFRFYEESTVVFSVMGQKQEEKDRSTLHLTATVGEKDEKGRIPVALKMTRVQGSVTGATRDVSIDTETFDQTKPIPAHEFVTNIALMRQPVQLLYEPSGKLVGVAGTDALVAEIDSMLRKDFAGTEDVEVAGPSYLANAREPALRALWSGVFIEELPADFQPGRAWEKTDEWPISPFELTTKTKSVAEEAPGGALEIDSKIEVVPSQPKTSKLGPLDWTYSVQNGWGTEKESLESDGWVRDSDSNLEINYTGSLGVGGQNLPFDMNLKLKFHVERVKE